MSQSTEIFKYSEIAKNFLEGTDPIKIISALISKTQEGKKLFVQEISTPVYEKNRNKDFDRSFNNKKSYPERDDMISFSLEIGKIDGVQVKNIVGAIANECGVPGSKIGQVKIFEDYSIVKLPKEDAEAAFRKLKNLRIINKVVNAKKMIR